MSNESADRGFEAAAATERRMRGKREMPKRGGYPGGPGDPPPRPKGAAAVVNPKKHTYVETDEPLDTTKGWPVSRLEINVREVMRDPDVPQWVKAHLADGLKAAGAPRAPSLIRDIAEIVAGLQMPYSIHKAVLGAAAEPWLNLWNKLPGFGWRDADKVERDLREALAKEIAEALG